MEKTNTTPKEAIDELTLALLYLCRFRVGKEPYWTSWKNYDFDTIDKLDDKGYLAQSRKTATLTEDGVRKAKEILAKYGIDDWPDGTFH